jgi:hypothetical protein
MKKLLILAIISLFLISCAKQEISPENLEYKTVVLSMHDIVLEPLQSQDFFVGLKNDFSEEITFNVAAVCRTNNCENNIIVQTFPQFSLGAGKKGAFPISVLVLEKSQKGNYTIKISASEDNRTYDSDEFTVEVPKTIEEVKESALQKLFK